MKKFIVALAGIAILFVFLNSSSVIACVAETEYDWGDAPYPYFTLASDIGAYHEILTGFYLGGGVDSEFDGQPNVNAQADSYDDGVFFLTPLNVGEMASISVIASDSGFLNAWMDFNHDGDWEDAGERIFSDISLAAGDNGLQFVIPVDAELDWTYARFRLSSTGLSSSSRFGGFGEVEDYMVQIAHAPVPNALILLGAGIMGMAGIGRRKTK